MARATRGRSPGRRGGRSIWLRRAYDQPKAGDGYRVLVDRLWPRGVAKADLELDEWCREVAPSDELRRWFGHDPARWSEFRTRYEDELAGDAEVEAEVARLAELADDRRLTLVYAAHDTERNNAVVLRDVLRRR